VIAHATVAGIAGTEVKMPPAYGTFKQAQRVDLPAAEQQGLDL